MALSQRALDAYLVEQCRLISTTNHMSFLETLSRVTSQGFRGQSKGFYKNTSEQRGMGRFELILPYNCGF
jgi:hypothetical protein